TDTGVFAENRYFDVFVEYAKAGPDDILMLITAHNRGPEPAPLHVMPQLFFRNIWSWQARVVRPILHLTDPGHVLASHFQLGQFHFYVDGNPQLLFCENDTNPRRMFGMTTVQGYWKDAFHDYVISGKKEAVNPAHSGTKCAAHKVLVVQPGGAATV